MSQQWRFALVFCMVAAVKAIADDITDSDCLAEQKAQSLLQQRFQAVGSVEVSEVVCPPGGVSTFDRCWYLSETGGSCDAACSARGLQYSFAQPQDGMTPLLVGHTPAYNLNPWLFVECYVPREDRYHPASRNAWGVPEKTPPGELAQAGQFTYSTCQLACPCAATAVVVPPSVTWPLPPTAASPTIAPMAGELGSGCEGGIFANGRCWYQGKTGDSCDNTCAAHGCEYSFAVPPADDMVPKLVGHMPHGRQDPWLFLECYVPKEDRYHPFNTNAWGVPVKTPPGEIANAGQFSYDTCRLSCPCAGNCVFAVATAASTAPVTTTLVPTPPAILPTLPPTSAPVKCNDGIGISALSRCWYLSNTGESCDSACASHGFSYLYASPIDDMVPKLVGHEPTGPKGEPWLFAECYIGKEDRYHPANPGTWGVPSKTLSNELDKVGQYSYESCMLACPCAAAVTPPPSPPTLPPVQPTPAVQTTLSPIPTRLPGCSGVASVERCWFLSDQGKNCDGTCAASGSSCRYSWAAPKEDITPLLVGHVPAGKQSPWLSLECYVPQEDRYHTVNVNAAKHDLAQGGNYSYSTCSLACPCTGTCDGSKEAPPAPMPVEEPKEICTWTAPAACEPTFTYQDKEYTGCAMWVDHPTPWCSHEKFHAGKWSLCTRVCQ